MVNLKPDFERLEGAKAALLARVGSLDSATLNRRPDPQTWSILQVIAHLTKSEAGTLNYIRKKTQDPAALPKAGLTAWVRVGVLLVGLESPFRFKAPASTADVPETADPVETFAAWGRVRDDWRPFASNFPDNLSDRLIFRHPFVGLLGPRQVMVFLLWHLKHHTRQVGRIRKALNV
jgi:hypothetical protein